MDSMSCSCEGRKGGREEMLKVWGEYFLSRVGGSGRSLHYVKAGNSEPRR